MKECVYIGEIWKNQNAVIAGADRVVYLKGAAERPDIETLSPESKPLAERIINDFGGSSFSANVSVSVSGVEVVADRGLLEVFHILRYDECGDGYQEDGILLNGFDLLDLIRGQVGKKLIFKIQG